MTLTTSSTDNNAQALLALLSGRSTEVSDWGGLLNLAENQRLLPNLWAAIDRKVVPREQLDATDDKVMQLTLEEVHRGKQLAELVQLLHPEVLAYKGPTLGLLAFNNAAARQSGDLDLLVPPDRYRRSVTRLLEDGFEFLYAPIPRCYLTLNYEVTLFHPRRGVTVDLHRSFFSQAMPLELSGRTTVTIGGYPIPTLPPEELFVLLSVHGCKHAWRELRWVYDLVGLMNRQNLDWEKIERLSLQSGSRRAVTVGLELSRKLFETATPPNLAGDETARRLARESEQYIFGKAPDLRRLQRYQWRVFDRFEQRLRYLVVTLFRPHSLDLAWVDLPENMWYLYYPLRPLRIVWDYLTADKKGERIHGGNQTS